MRVVGGGPYDLFRLNRVQYSKLAASGFFGDTKVQLIDGVVLVRPRPSAKKAFVVGKLNQLLSIQLGDSRIIRVGLPLALSERSEPEPDLAVVSEKDTDPGADHPSSSPLIIEVSDSSRTFDLGLKADLYAAARLPEYWVVDLKNAKIVVHLEPKKGRYQRVHRFGRGKAVTSTIAPRVTVKVNDLFV